MLRLTKGFRASLDLSSSKPTGVNHYDQSPGVTLTGAYKTNQNEYIEKRSNSENIKKTAPSMARVPNSNLVTNQTKSTTDLVKPPVESLNLSKSTPNIPQANNRPTSLQIPVDKNARKKYLAEQKKREKLAVQEQKKAEKQRRELEKKRIGPILHTRHRLVPENCQDIPIRHLQKNPVPVVKKNAAPQPPVSYSTNTLESSISRSSGPPPYSPPETVRNESDNSGNTSFIPAKDTGSWDLISQHRQQINRPKVTSAVPKQTHLNLNYNTDNTKGKQDNSDA